MNMRRLARERAIQFLYQVDLNSPDSVAEELERFWEFQRLESRYSDDAKATWAQAVELPPPTAQDLAIQEFAASLITGTVEHLKEIDEQIVKYAKNWNINRIANVDKTILRLAIYEMLYRNDIPPVVSINEAVDIAKKYSTEDSGKFVNGILDKVRENILRPSRRSIS